MRITFLLLLSCLGLWAQPLPIQHRPPVSSGAVPITSDLIAWWEMDASGANQNRPDFSGNGHTLNYVSGTIDVNGDCIYTNSLYVHLGGPGVQSTDAAFNMVTGQSISFAGWFLQTAVVFSMAVFGQWDDSAGVGTDDSYYLGCGLDNPPSFHVRKGDNSGIYNVQSTVTTVPSQWYFFACGYDAPNNQIWISLNGEPRVNTTVTTVRTRSSVYFGAGGVKNVNTTFGGIDGLVDQMGVWGRVLSASDIAFLMADQNIKGLQANSAGVAPASRWVAQAVAAGGTAPSAASSNAVIGYINSAVAANIYRKVRWFMPIVPDSLIVGYAPVVRGGRGASVGGFVNHNFVVGDLTVNGLAGDGSSKYLDTGWVAASWLTKNNTGIVIYNYATGVAANVLNFGSQDGSGNSFNMFPCLNGSSYLDCYNYNVGNGRLIAAGANVNGYYSGQVTSGSSESIYFANSGTAHTLLTNTAAGSTLTMPNFSTYLWNVNVLGSPYGPGYSDSRLSFIEVTEGLSSSESAANYTAVQALRVALGGGYR